METLLFSFIHLTRLKEEEVQQLPQGNITQALTQSQQTFEEPMTYAPTLSFHCS